MMIMKCILFIIGGVMVLMSPVIYIWCIKEHKSLKDGLKDWVKESEGDL